MSFEIPQDLIGPLLLGFVYNSDDKYVPAGDAQALTRVEGFPEDTDWNRWAMLHDGAYYRLYFFRQDSNDTLYQGAFDPQRSSYVYGHESHAQLELKNVPDDADCSRFAMLFDGETYYLYLKNQTNPLELILFEFNDAGTPAYEANGNRISLTNPPSDLDFSGWDMLYDASAYRLYHWKAQTDGSTIYQAAYNDTSYEFGYDSILEMQVEGLIPGDYANGFGMLHDGKDYRYYRLRP